MPDGSADVGVDGQAGRAELTLGAPDDYELGRLVVRAQVAAASEDLPVQVVGRAQGTVTVALGRPRGDVG